MDEHAVNLHEMNAHAVNAGAGTGLEQERERFPAGVFFADADFLEDPKMLRRAMEAADPARREKVLRFKHEGAKRLSLAAGLLLIRVLWMYSTGADPDRKSGDGESGDRKPGDRIPSSFPASLRFGEEKSGKPFLLEGPDSIEGLQFNLSHSGNIVMCAAAGCAVGCDVQEKSRNVDPVLRCLTPSEREMVRRDAENFYRIWTLKESYIKMTGEGLSRPLQSFEAMLEPEAGIAAEGFHGTVREYAGPPPCRYACCIERGSLPEEMARIRLEDTLW